MPSMALHLSDTHLLNTFIRSSVPSTMLCTRKHQDESVVFLTHGILCFSAETIQANIKLTTSVNAVGYEKKGE